MHPYLRAYMAGIALPTMVMPVVVVGLRVLHPVDQGFAVENCSLPDRPRAQRLGPVERALRVAHPAPAHPARAVRRGARIRDLPGALAFR